MVIYLELLLNNDLKKNSTTAYQPAFTTSLSLFFTS